MIYDMGRYYLEAKGGYGREDYEFSFSCNAKCGKTKPCQNIEKMKQRGKVKNCIEFLYGSCGQLSSYTSNNCGLIY